MSPTKETVYELRLPRVEDGSSIWSFIRSVGALDVNSAYCYLMLCKYFRSSCVIAEAEGEIVGFLSSFRKPEHPQILFVWQLAVASSQRGQGLAGKMLEELLSRQEHRDVNGLEATISPSNQASQAVFRKLAKRRGAQMTQDTGFTAEHFPPGGHEDELVFRIGPLKQGNGGSEY